MSQLRRLSLVLVAALILVGPGAALADSTSSGGQILVVSDEIWGRSVEVERPSLADSGKDNNGHGNNTDGVDSSNPGQGDGGPNGGDDASCLSADNCVDDESSGGGSVVSSSNNGNSE